ncbi:MAG TPA: NAD(P)H-hydrate dehydratase [Candidatus Xenobia bacterium]|nr:NAD(P)H-hydrate dehydratase [Candidatus Xenobia bacterium]
MKILTADEMRGVDRRTTEQAGVSYRQLMENAGRQVADFIIEEVLMERSRGDRPVAISILCGKGNNGGDALVAARHLWERGFKPRVCLLAPAAELKGDARANYEAYLELGATVQELSDPAAWQRERNAVLDCDIVVDGLLGTGLTGAVQGHLAQVIADVNARRDYRVVAVDIPSGLPSDSGAPLGDSIRADATVTFTAPKRGQIFPPSCTRVGRLAVAPIGTPEALLENDPNLWLNLIVARDFSRVAHARKPWAHKGDYGHVLLVAGSRGKSGAAALGGKAALRMGAGLATVATAASIQPVVASMVAEVMTEPLPETESSSISNRALDYGRFAKLLEGKSVLAMGPGLTTHPETAQFVRAVLEQFEIPLVLDADALNALVGQLEVLRRRKSRLVVLTPHPGEMARLLGTTSDDVQRQRVEVAQKFARDFDVFVILKGHRTLLAAPDGQVWVNPTGNPGMATGGSGDVLTGLVAGALAQFPAAKPAEALGLAVFLHGLAGDAAAGALGEQAMIASDILEALPRAWLWLRDRLEADDPGRYYLVP